MSPSPPSYPCWVLGYGEKSNIGFFKWLVRRVQRQQTPAQKCSCGTCGTWENGAVGKTLADSNSDPQHLCKSRWVLGYVLAFPALGRRRGWGRLAGQLV